MIFLLSVLAVAVNAVLLIVFYRRLSSRFSPDRVLGEIRGELDRLVADLGRETDRDVALLENRIRGLRSLIDEADRRILLADRESAKRRDEESTMSSLSRPVAVAAEILADNETSAGDDMPAEVQRSAIPEMRITDAPPAARGDGTYSRESIMRSRVVNASRRVQPVIPTVEHVVSLANKGFSADIIASKLSLSLGEVELILDIHVNKASGFDTATKDSRS